MTTLPNEELSNEAKQQKKRPMGMRAALANKKRATETDTAKENAVVETVEDEMAVPLEDGEEDDDADLVAMYRSARVQQQNEDGMEAAMAIYRGIIHDCDRRLRNGLETKSRMSFYKIYGHALFELAQSGTEEDSMSFYEAAFERYQEAMSSGEDPDVELLSATLKSQLTCLAHEKRVESNIIIDAFAPLISFASNSNLDSQMVEELVQLGWFLLDVSCQFSKRALAKASYQQTIALLDIVKKKTTAERSLIHVLLVARVALAGLCIERKKEYEEANVQVSEAMKEYSLIETEANSSDKDSSFVEWKLTVIELYLQRGNLDGLLADDEAACESSYEMATSMIRELLALDESVVPDHLRAFVEGNNENDDSDSEDEQESDIDA